METMCGSLVEVLTMRDVTRSREDVRREAGFGENEKSKDDVALPESRTHEKKGRTALMLSLPVRRCLV